MPSASHLAFTVVLSWRNTPLPMARPGEERRGLLEAVLDVQGLRVRVMTTHFQHDNAASRLVQPETVAAAVEASREPVVLTGDLNARADAPEIAALTGTMTDSHARAGHGDGATHPAEAPNARIDYVLSTKALPVWSRVLTSDASDHLPVLARLVVVRR
ncbi:endonuclease/exonuclease/phosphatase family protein [Actinophytocola xanthii]|uniref:Endonuclease/exonuclease/phosphatase domain-containing protein n=1 Tax=Actinophytocola xanthii TaxID=1912961 RepID=A0A1Q8CXZ4_9PSEU|nr:endonuclease/exonuclease/phosphatase family protein [Actinophytocola xanthii]OLF19215.1 hypothetical protein BU204_02355 [Actinophytocola xanthii]